MSTKNTIPFRFNKGNKSKVFMLKVPKIYNASNFNRDFFPLLANNKIPLKLLIHCFISLNVLTGEEGIIPDIFSQDKAEAKDGDTCELARFKPKNPRPQKMKKAANSDKSKSNSRLSMGLQDNGHYNFPKTLNKDNLIFKKMYQLLGLDYPGLKIKLNQRFWDHKMLIKYLYDFIENNAISNHKNFYTTSMLLKNLYIRLLTNLWTFLIVHQEKIYQEFIKKYLINEIGKLRKTLNKNLYMPIFIEKTPTYDPNIFTQFLNETYIKKHDLKVIQSANAVHLHYHLLLTFHRLFVVQRTIINTQKYALYLHKFEPNNYIFKNLIEIMRNNNIFYEFNNLSINSETCKITKNALVFDDNTNDHIFTCKKIKIK
ncbi:hypothetical protein TCON_2286 [Astathelohania contejeani]|uniref:Uncharacterized protein n=1 Tax=Astathelohania contejeani TaxID=164912 RepID=A0ABQ7HWI7_9MICR|nr:hypothetical protein TCON_2286 [Thelohania contejeani]